MFKRLTAATLLIGSLALLAAGAAISAPPSGSSFPSGQRMFGNTSFDATATPPHFVGGGGTVESAYDATTGTLIYLQTPNNAQVHPAKKIDPATGLPVNVAPIYIPVYPVGSGHDPSMLNCAHRNAAGAVADNCPDHGPAIAGLTTNGTALHALNPSVSTSDLRSVVRLYGAGVLGHDHLAGIASTGGDFNVVWEPVLVLFTNSHTATYHFTKLSEINRAVNANLAIEVPLPALDFNCTPVSAAKYWQSTPAPTAPPTS